MHKGFYGFWTSLHDTVLNAVADGVAQCGSACDTIVVVGHSLGGALSTLSSVELVDLYPNYNGAAYC